MNQTYIVGGIIGGLVAGVAFGVLSQMMGMMPMIAMLVHSESLAIGWFVHLAISVGAGVVLGVALSWLASSYWSAAGYGLLYGVAWWFFGMLIAMPLMLGMPAEIGRAFDQANLMSLMGHVIWGVLLALILIWYAKKASAGSSAPQYQQQH